MVKQIIKFNYWTNLMKCHDGNVGETAIVSMTDDEYESMTEDQLIDLLVSETPAVDEEYKIVDINITNN